ncbi:hypothetical protein ACJX0J_020735, partial [Zea mays]
DGNQEFTIASEFVTQNMNIVSSCFPLWQANGTWALSDDNMIGAIINPPSFGLFIITNVVKEWALKNMQLKDGHYWLQKPCGKNTKMLKYLISKDKEEESNNL